MANFRGKMWQLFGCILKDGYLAPAVLFPGPKALCWISSKMCKFCRWGSQNPWLIFFQLWPFCVVIIYFDSYVTCLTLSFKVLLTQLIQLGISKMLKKTILIYMVKITDFFHLCSLRINYWIYCYLKFTKCAGLIVMYFLVLKRTFRSSNFPKHWYFPLNFGTCQDHSILDKIVPTIFKKKLVLVLFVFWCFQKYTMTSIHKNPKIYVNIHYFTNCRQNFLHY